MTTQALLVYDLVSNGHTTAGRIAAHLAINPVAAAAMLLRATAACTITRAAIGHYQPTTDHQLIDRLRRGVVTLPTRSARRCALDLREGKNRWPLWHWRRQIAEALRLRRDSETRRWIATLDTYHICGVDLDAEQCSERGMAS